MKFGVKGAGPIHFRDEIRRALIFYTVIPVAVVVLEAQFAGAAVEHPGARAVFADLERDADRVGLAAAHVHDQGLADERVVGAARGVGDDAPGEGLPAQRPQAFEQRGRARVGGGAFGRGRGLHGVAEHAAAEQQGGGEGQQGERAQDRTDWVHARTLAAARDAGKTARAGLWPRSPRRDWRPGRFPGLMRT